MACELSSSMFSLTILFFLFLFPISSHGTVSTAADPFGFVKDLQGSRKGDKAEGNQKLKKYLEMFGYLSGTPSETRTHDDFDDLLESAIKTYQKNFNLKATGHLDSATVSEMMKPRCAVADIINGTNWMLWGKRRHLHRRHGSLRASPLYNFFPGSPAWPSDKTELTYGFLSDTPSIAVEPVSRAFGQWQSATHFRFRMLPESGSADLIIGFRRLDHGDGAAFDGPGGAVAHAFAPTEGIFHYDGDEIWSDRGDPAAIDLETTAVHEIGHLLGLAHSSVPDAIMFPTIGRGQVKGIADDDIQGIKDLYNL